ncbi:uncharacterized protein RCC_01200 [Ramularia collo-cygni]|uniref:Peptidase S54 rhomboid domain-containing protein n=1 Tax=Ramularia collo-cygni TaxID=112498 RepID=A0A2D3UTX3_9PEZI|nr:uncharacterized protein RCC_01200 [Ramularia collo-cygni]CZT15337.1 uncharacterized protein RCC_01200 [Ramularia collo-cygni]
MENTILRMLTRRAPLLKNRLQPSFSQSHKPQRRAFMSNGRPFWSRESNPWTRILGPNVSGSSITARAFHSSPEAAHRGYIGAKRVLWTMIGLNTAVFGAWQVAEATKNHELLGKLHRHALLSQRNIDSGRYYTFVTNAFSHKDLGHFVFNMMALHAFGTVASGHGIGGVHMTMLALGSAIASSYALYYQRSSKDKFKKSASGIWQRFGNGNTRVIEIWHGLGASGIVMGMGATATLLAPMARIAVFFVPMPLFVLTAGYVAFDFYHLDSETSRVGHAAHLGGLAFGAAYYLTSLRGYGGVWQWVRRGLRR